MYKYRVMEKKGDKYIVKCIESGEVMRVSRDELLAYSNMVSNIFVHNGKIYGRTDAISVCTKLCATLIGDCRLRAIDIDGVRLYTELGVDVTELVAKLFPNLRVKAGALVCQNVFYILNGVSEELLRCGYEHKAYNLV